MSMSESPSPALWSTVAALPDYLLLAQTRQLARHEQALQILVLDHLREIEARGLHLTRGYGSLFDYVVHELGYTAAAAWRRIKAMRLCSATNGARELLQDGKLNLSNAAQLQNLFERSDRGHGRGRPPGGQRGGFGPGGVPRNDGAAGEPASEAPMRAGGGDPAPGAGPVLDAAAREELVKRAAGKSTREVQQMVAEVDPELARPNDRMRALGGGRWELKATVDAECRHGLEKLQMLLSHQDPHLTLGGLVARLVREGMDRYDPERPRSARRSGRGGAVNGARTASAPERCDTEAVQRSVAGATGSAAERRSEVEPGNASPAAVRAAVPRPSAPKRHADAEQDSAKSAAVREDAPRASAPKRYTDAVRGRVKVEVVQRSVARAKRDDVGRPGEVEQYAASLAAVRPGSPRPSAPKPHAGAEHGNESGPAPNTSPTKRQYEAEVDRVSRAVARDGDGQADSAPERPGGSAASVPGGQREMEQACEPPKAMGGGGGPAVARPNRQRRDGGDGHSEGSGVPGRAAGRVEPHLEAGEHSASWAPVTGRRRFAASAAKRLQYAAGHGAVGPAERSPALERHLAALSCFDALPGSRSRYVPVAVKREVWRRDQGRCSYVDPHSGRRCGSRYRLEIDHVVPFALGGTTEPGNLRIRCRAHHRYRHASHLAHPASVPAEARRALDSAVDPGNGVQPAESG